MPNEPSPYLMRDWKQVAQDYDDYVFSFTRGRPNADSWWQDYPLIWWDTTRYNYPFDTFGMPSYIGHPGMTGGMAHESINVLGAVLGGALVGIDKSNQYVAATGQSYNFALMQQQYYNKTNGENMVLNYAATQSGQTFWYETVPGVLFCQLLWKYPNTGEMETIMYTMANRFYDAAYVMGGRTSPWTVPNFTYTAFNFLTMQPVYNGKWREPDAAGGYAWVDYMAFCKWGEPHHLVGARWGVEYLLNRTQNPLYELLLPHGALTAARLNAELGYNYDLHKLLNWCFEPSTASDARQGWGVIADNPWNGYDCDGLVGSVTDGGGYAFAMNTYQWVGTLTPIARYNQDYARTIGKWVLNAANASRLFYANGLDADHQSSEGWSYSYDPSNCISYEGLRKNGRMIEKALSDYSHTYGVATFTYQNTLYINDGKYQILQEQRIGVPPKGKVEHVWNFNITPGMSHYFRMNGYYTTAGSDDTGFDFFWSTSPTGPWTSMFKVTKTAANTDFYGYSLPSELSGPLYVMAKDDFPDTVDGGFDTLYVDSMFVWTETTTSPYAMGDGISSFPWGTQTDLATYGASHVGMMAAVVETTNIQKILQLDLLATDYYHAPAYPTYLYYNPYTVPQTVSLDVGTAPVDVYDTVSQGMLKVNVSGAVDITIPADSAVVTVLAPAGGQVTIEGTQKKIEGLVVDYKTNIVFDTCEKLQASPGRMDADLDGNCVIDIEDLRLFSESWLTDTNPGRADINRDSTVDMEDISVLSSQWLMENSF